MVNNLQDLLYCYSNQGMFLLQNVKDCYFFEMGRAGVWYTNDINITDVKIIRNVSLCHGRNHPQSNVKNAEAI